MDRRKEVGAQPEEVCACGEGMSAFFEERSTAPATLYEESNEGVCKEKEQDDQNLTNKNKLDPDSIEGGKDEGVCNGGYTDGEGGEHGNAIRKSGDGYGTRGTEGDPTRLAVLLAIERFGTNAARVAQAEQERDLFRAVFGDPTDEQKAHALLSAAERGDHWALSVLLDDGVHPDGIYLRGTTALMTAAKFSQLTCVKLLLTRGASVNRQDYAGYTALHYAAEGPRLPPQARVQVVEDEPTLSVVSALLGAGADKTMTNIRGQVAWQSAILGGHDHHFKPSPVMTLLQVDGITRAREQYL